MSRPDAEARLAAAAFRLLAKEPWNRLTLTSVARAAKVPLEELLRIAPSRAGLVGVMLRRAAADTAKHYKPDRSARGTRECVFEAILSWFEAQNARKVAVRSLYDGLRCEPLTLLLLRSDFVLSATWLLALAEDDAGTASPVRAACVGGIVARVLPVWLADDEGMGKTMAQVDRDLRRVERFLWRSEKPHQKPRRKTRAR
jgi:AcrR family transcriptional regulator